MSDDRKAMTEMTKGYIGVSAQELSLKSDEELALWQSNHKDETALQILAEQEWQRRKLPKQKPSFWLHPLTRTILYIIGVVVAAAIVFVLGFKK